MQPLKTVANKSEKNAILHPYTIYIFYILYILYLQVESEYFVTWVAYEANSTAFSGGQKTPSFKISLFICNKGYITIIFKFIKFMKS